MPIGRRKTNSQEIPSSGSNLHNAKPLNVKRWTKKDFEIIDVK